MMVRTVYGGASIDATEVVAVMPALVGKPGHEVPLDGHVKLVFRGGATLGKVVADQQVLTLADQLGQR